MDDARIGQGTARNSDFESRIDQVYRTEIEPDLNAFLADEEEEKRRVRRFRIWVMVPFVLVFVGGAVSFVLGDQVAPAYPVAFVALLCVGLAIAAFARPAPKQRPDLRYLVTQPICRLVGDMRYALRPVDEIDPLTFKDIGVVPNFDSWQAEHLFVGRHRGREFRVCEANLMVLSAHEPGLYRSKFKGRLFDIDAPAPFTGRMLILGDRGALGNWLGALLRDKFAGMARIETQDPAFEARYEVYSDAPQEARGMLGPDFLAAMVDLAEAADEKALNAAFVDGRFLLALPCQRSLFDIGESNPPRHRMRAVFAHFVREFTLPHRVIDFLHGDRPQLP